MEADATSTGSGQTLLIVDDDPSNLESLVRIFRRERVEVLTATDGKEALAALRKTRVSVVLTDLMMPLMNGLELLRASKTVSPETEFILMTAFGTVETAVEAMKEGAREFVLKPFEREELLYVIRSQLNPRGEQPM